MTRVLAKLICIDMHRYARLWELLHPPSTGWALLFLLLLLVVVVVLVWCQQWMGGLG